MKKLIYVATILIAITLQGQKKSTFDMGLGFSQNGGLSFSFSSKYKNSFGWYLACRGLNIEDDYLSGVDYSTISDAKELASAIKDTNDFGVTAGTIYNIKNSNLSIGAGLGYGIEQKRVDTTILYDFHYIPDEYGVQFSAIKRNVLTGELFLDYSFKNSLNKSFGVQVGYNTLQKAFGILYYSF